MYSSDKIIDDRVLFLAEQLYEAGMPA